MSGWRSEAYSENSLRPSSGVPAAAKDIKHGSFMTSKLNLVSLCYVVCVGGGAPVLAGQLKRHTSEPLTDSGTEAIPKPQRSIKMGAKKRHAWSSWFPFGFPLTSHNRVLTSDRPNDVEYTSSISGVQQRHQDGNTSKGPPYLQTCS